MRRLAAVVLLIIGLATSADALRATSPSPPPTASLSLSVPTLGSCGTSPSLATGSTDSYGQITTGSGVVTSCALNFSHTLSRQPFCILSTNSTAITADVASVSTSVVTFGLSATLTSGQIYYHCLGAS